MWTLLRDDLWKNHPQIHIVDFDFYDVAVFNRCENNNCVLMAIENWRYVHPLLKILPVDWDYPSPLGFFILPTPSRRSNAFCGQQKKTAGQREWIQTINLQVHTG